jgi:hypothetical protein
MQVDTGAGEYSDSQSGKIIAVLVALFVAAACCQYGCDARDQFEARSFPHVVGQMTRHAWNEFGTDGESELLVEYNFTVDGQRYFGDCKRFAYRHFSSESDAAIALARSWGQGNQVKVFYDPDDPGHAALDNLFTPGDWKTLAVALIGMFLALLVLGVLLCDLFRSGPPQTEREGVEQLAGSARVGMLQLPPVAAN